MTGRRLDRTALVAGLVVTLLGILLLLDRLAVLDLRFGFLFPAVAATLGAILLTSGLTERGD